MGERDRPIGDYAIIGDCRSAALVSRDASIDWLCMPRFDSPSVLAALVDAERGGRFRVRPAVPHETSRRYLPGTNVLETTFRTDTGSLRVVDAMLVGTSADGAELSPDHELLRSVECTQGHVELDVCYAPRPGYARLPARLEDRGPLGIALQSRAGVWVLRGELPLRIDGDRSSATARLTLQEGERRRIALAFAHREPAVVPLLDEHADRRLQHTIEWWRGWSDRCAYEGPYREAVIRSALTLKLLTFAPSGAVVAAPTTSLPESLGGSRNWDYRYCWLRDASMTLQALLDLGYVDEGQAFLSWLLHTTRLSWPTLQVLYNVYGETRLDERELGHLAGWQGSTPVRVGNDAHMQLQLDIYGEVLDAVYEFVRRGGALDRSTRRFAEGLGATVCRRWREADEGIWEVRSGPRQHTHSKAMCWVALDRLVRLADQGVLDIPGDIATERDAIRERIERDGWNDARQTYARELGGEAVDASLLLMSRYGYADPGSERMRRTVERVSDELGRDDLTYRYRDHDDGLSGEEGVFVVCSFWRVSCLARAGEWDAAEELFEQLLGRANDVGLYSEELDAATGALLGNFPQAFSHVGLIDAALDLQESVRAGRPRHETVALEGARVGDR